METYIYENGHINSIQPYYVMLNGQRYNAAHFNGRIVFGITEEVEPTVPPTEPPTPTPTPPPTPVTEYTPFFITNPTSTAVTLNIESGGGGIGTLECSTDLINWEGTSLRPTIGAYETVYYRCDYTIKWTNNGCWEFKSTSNNGSIKAGGNILSLVYGENFAEQTTFKDNGESQFSELFMDNHILVNAEDLILPVNNLTEGCYANMFRNCSQLLRVPELPATTLATGCYQGMFASCHSLTSAPALPARVLVNSCYAEMFWGCNRLNNIKCLATNLSATDCLTNWLKGVSSTGTFYKKAGVTWPTGTSGIPTGWTVVEV